MNWPDNYKQAEKFSGFYGYWDRFYGYWDRFIWQLSVIQYCKFKVFNKDSSVKERHSFVTKSSNEEEILFEALRESVNVTLDKYSPI